MSCRQQFLTARCNEALDTFARSTSEETVWITVIRRGPSGIRLSLLAPGLRGCSTLKFVALESAHPALLDPILLGPTDGTERWTEDVLDGSNRTAPGAIAGVPLLAHLDLRAPAPLRSIVNPPEWPR